VPADLLKVERIATSSRTERGLQLRVWNAAGIFNILLKLGNRKSNIFHRSKVKCDNEGVKSTCQSCARSGRNCRYLPAGASSASKRSEIEANIEQEDGTRVKRVRKVEDVGWGSSNWLEDPLESPVLTRKVWDEVYDIFKLHFSTEMSFLHPPTFRNRMRQASYPRDPSVAPTDLQDGRVLLLAILMLTARFHPELIAYHSQAAKSSNALDASEYYATALKIAFGPMGSNLPSPHIDGIQALLMLGLYEWSQTRGLNAWVYSGIAIRLAQSNELAYEDDKESRTFKASSALLDNRSKVRDNATEIEVRRRTFWSCFIMDRMLATGKHRPTMISVKQLKVQLPGSDDQFLFVRDEATNFLDKSTRVDEIVNDDSVLGRYIRLVEIFGRSSEWICAGGRRTETLPPWDSSTQFFRLRQELGNFHMTLPSNLIFTNANLSAYIEKRNATTYASMHTLYSLCLIMLHREYIPPIPLMCMRPQGPLDAQIFPENQYHSPGGFWEESAETIFKAARDIVHIVQTCQDNNALPESPQIGFAIWQAASVCVYAAHFQHMDVGEYVHLRSGQSNDDHGREGYVGRTMKILGEMSPRLKMAKGYLAMVEKMHSYFSTVKTKFQERIYQGWSDAGFLEGYKTFEKELREFGSLHNTDESVASDTLDSADQACSRVRYKRIGKESVNRGSTQAIEAAPKSRARAAINSTKPANGNDGRKVSPSQGGQYNTNHQQSPKQNHNPPSLVSLGESTLGTNLLYTQDQSYLNSGQQQHRPVSASVGRHILPTRSVQGERQWLQEANPMWITSQEARSNASLCYDNITQLNYSLTPFGDLPADMQDF
jgi:hypothetical protein